MSKTKFSHGPAIHSLVYMCEICLCPQENLHTNFTAAFFIVHKRQKQPKCPSTDKRTGTGLAILWNMTQPFKKNKVLIHSKTEEVLVQHKL